MVKTAPLPKLVILKQSLVGILIASLIGVVGYGLWHFSRIDGLTLKEISVVGGETVPHEKVIEVTQRTLDGSYFHFVPRRFAWTYPKAEILKAIYDIDRVKNVHLERDGGEKLLIAFEEYQPFALWCKELTSRNCLFLDSSGYAFAAAPVLDGGAFLRYSETDREPAIKTDAFPSEFIRSTNLFVANAYETLGLNIIQVEKTGEDDILYHIAGGGVVKASNRLSTEETLENLAAILNSEEFSHIEPGNFKYIDLRFGNKVFVNEVMEEALATTTEAVAVPDDN